MNELPGCEQLCDTPLPSSLSSGITYDGGASCFCTTSLNDVIAQICTWINAGANSYTDLQAKRAAVAATQDTPSLKWNRSFDNILRADVDDIYVRGLLHQGAGITYNPASGIISNSGVTSFNGQRGDIIFNDANNFPLSLTFSGGVLTMQRNGLTDLTANLDGRYLTTYTETDPVATAKTITLSQGTGISITGGTQTIGSNPTFTITSTITQYTDALAHAAFSAVSPILYDGTTGSFSHAISGISDGFYNNVHVNVYGHIVAGTNVAYLTSYTETDPIFSASPAFGITNTLVSHWNTAYNKFPTSVSVSGGTTKTLTVTLNDASTLTGSWTDLDNNNYLNLVTFSGGLLTFQRIGLPDLVVNMDGRYLTTYSESDPVFVASAAHSITNTNITNWNTAYNKYITGGTYAAGTITFTRNDLSTFGVSIPVTSAPNTQVMYGTGTGYTSSSNFTWDGANLSLIGTPAVLLNYAAASANLKLWTINAVTDSGTGGSFLKIGALTDAGASIDSSHDNMLVIKRTGWIGLGIATVFGTERLRVIGDTYMDATLKIASLASGGTAPTTTGTTVMVVADQNGLLSFAAIPSGSGANNYTTGVSLAAGTFTVTRNGLSNLTATFNLDQIGQVAITSPANNQILQYNSGTSKWTNVNSPYLTAETDPIFVASTAHGITSTDVSHWNTAYNKYPTTMVVSGTSTKTITLTLNDASTITANFTDISSGGTTTLTATQIAFGDGSNVLSSSSNLTWSGTILKIGQDTTGNSTATPKSIDLGSDFSNTHAANLKLTLYNDGAGTIYGIGASLQQVDYVVETAGDHVFYHGAGESLRIFHDKTIRGALYTGTGNRLTYFDNNGVFQRSTIDPANVVLSSRTLTINGVTFDLSADRSWTISTGSGGISDAYKVMSDGTNTSVAVGSDTFKFRSANNLLSVLVQNNDVTFGDNLLLTVNQANIQINESQVTNLTSDLSFKVPTSRTITINGTTKDLNSDQVWTVGGSVTSVAATIASSALAIAGSPITGAGTLAFSWTGNNTQYVAGDGSKIAFPAIPTVSGTTGRLAEFTGASSIGNSNWTHFTTGGAERYGLGTTSPGAALHIESSEGNVFELSRTGVQLFLVNFDSKTTIGNGDVTGAPVANRLNVIQDNSTSGTNLIGMFRANQTVATSGSIQGLEAYTKTAHSSGSVPLAIGLVGNVEHAGTGTGTAGDLRGTQAGVVINSNTAVTNAFALFVACANIASGTSTLTNSYGVYIKAAAAGGGTISNKYNIYTEDTTATNLLNGKVQFPSLSSPASDRLLGMVNSTGEVAAVTIGTNLTLSGGTLNASGEANTASNVAATQNTSINAAFYKTKSGVQLQFKGVSSPVHGGIAINGLTNEVEIKNNAYDQYDTATGFTTGATTTAITTIAGIPSGSIGWVEIVTAAANTTVTAGAKMTVWFAKDGGGTLTVINTSTLSSFGTSIGTTTTSVSSGSLNINGTGSAGNNLNWVLVYKVRYLALS